MAKKKRKSANMQKREKPTKLERISDALIDERIEELAALSWVGYQQEGRGMVILAQDEEGGIDATYAGKRGEMWRVLDFDNEMPQLAKLVNEYDPLTQMVVLNGVAEDRPIIVIEEMDVPPPIAFEKLMAQ